MRANCPGETFNPFSNGPTLVKWFGRKGGSETDNESSREYQHDPEECDDSGSFHVGPCRAYFFSLEGEVGVSSPTLIETIHSTALLFVDLIESDLITLVGFGLVNVDLNNRTLA